MQIDNAFGGYNKRFSTRNFFLVEAYTWVHLLHNTPKRPNVSSFCCVPELNFLSYFSPSSGSNCEQYFYCKEKRFIFNGEHLKAFLFFLPFRSIQFSSYTLHVFLRQITPTKYTYILRQSWVCFDTKSCIFKILVLKSKINAKTKDLAVSSFEFNTAL